MSSYRLLHAALNRSDRVGIGRFVFHNKAHLVAVRAVDEVIVLHTMRFADELASPRELEFRRDSEAEEARDRHRRALVDQLSSSFRAGEYSDTYREGAAPADRAQGAR